ncbi:MAG TPA: hypothetical protein VMU51_24120 [Mycobacteriales bacterium]|nr:hypothetical protein [Mycobacteriales bacterium]
MPNEGSRGIRRAAAVALIGGFVTLAATPALAAGPDSPAPDGTRVTGTGDGYPWVGSNPWETSALPDGHGWIESGATGGDGHGWTDGDFPNPWGV